MKIAFVGGGNMARALIGGLLQRGFAAEAISVTDIDAQARIAARGAICGPGHRAAGSEVQSSDVVLLAVKPQHMREVAENIGHLLQTQLVVSIAAGVRTADLSRWLGGYERIVRAMPRRRRSYSRGFRRSMPVRPWVLPSASGPRKFLPPWALRFGCNRKNSWMQ